MAISKQISSSNHEPKKVLIAGGCYAGLATALNLLDLCEGRPARFTPDSEPCSTKVPVEITIADERDGYYHIIGSPLALASKGYASKAWIRFDEVPALQHPSINFVHGSVSKVDIEAKSAAIIHHGSSQAVTYKYDYFISATGLRRVWPVVPQNLKRKDYLREAGKHIDAVNRAQNGVVVIGGGAVGIEMAAELKLTQPDAHITLIHSRDRLMSSEPLPDEFKDACLALLRKEGVKVITGTRVLSQVRSPDDQTTTLSLSDGTTISTSVVIKAISHSTPTSSYLPSGVLSIEGYVKIKPSLHFHDEYHFAAGDIALWSGIKRCGGAMHMGYHCAFNIHQHMLYELQRPSHGTMTKDAPQPESRTRALDSFSPKYKELGEFPPMIGIAIGHIAAAYSPTDGVKSGTDILSSMFGDDLGFNICYTYLNLGVKMS